MLPTLLVGSIALPTYPLLIIVALWLGITLSSYRAYQLNIDGDHVYNAALYAIIGGILGARIWFVLSHWENYAPDITQALSLSRSALSTGEGLIVAGLVILIYLYRYKLPIGQFFDALAPGLILALVIIHIGALLGGEGIGLPSDVPWAIEMINTTRHPVQAYFALGCVLVLLVLFLIRTYLPWPGFQFWVFVLLYGVVRLFLEVFRANPTIVGGGFLAVQLLALSAITIALAVMAYNFNQSNSPRIEVSDEVVG